MREALLLDLGALVFELHRHGRREPVLLQAKAAELSAVDEEVRALAEALGSDHTVMQLVATGVAGSCENCGSLMSVDARYCSSCGVPAVPALAGDGERRAFARDETTDEHAALATGVVPEPEEEQAPEESAEEEAFSEEEEGAEEPEPEPEPEQEIPSEAGEPEDLAPDDTAEQEPIDEGVIRVTRMPPSEDEAAEAEEPGEPEEREEDEEPEDHEEPAAWAPEESAGEDGSDGREQTEHPPRAIADDALDTAAKAIRSGLARGREWILGRRTEE